MVVIPANADGHLQLSEEKPPAGMPPALMVVDARIWAFVSTGTEDTSPWLIKLRADGSGTVVYTDYRTGTSTTGLSFTSLPPWLARSLAMVSCSRRE